MADEPVKTNEEEIKELQDRLLKEASAPPEEPKEEPKEEKPEIKEEPKEEKVEAKEEYEPVDMNKLKEEVRTEATEEVTNKIIKSLKGEEATQEEQDAYQKFATETYEKEGRNPTYNEAFKFMSQQVKEEIRAEDEAKAKEAEEQVKAKQEAEGQNKEQFNKYIDDQLADLKATGKLPEAADPKDENDPGVVAQKALFQKMMDVNTERVKDGKPPIYSLKEIYYEHYSQPTGPAGADAPVSAGRGGPPSNNKDEMPYDQLHKSDFIDIVTRR